MPRRRPPPPARPAPAAPGAGQRHRDRSRPAPGRLGRRPSGPAARRRGELLAFYNDSSTTRMQGDVSFPAGSSFTGRLALFRGSLAVRRPCAGRRRRHQRHALPAARRGRGRRRAGRGRAPHPEPGGAPRRAGARVVGCGAGDPHRRGHPDRARAAASVDASSRPRARLSRLGGCAPRCCSQAAAPTTGSKGSRSSLDRPSSCVRAAATAGPARCARPPAYRGRRLPAEQRLRLRRAGRVPIPGRRHRRPCLQRGGAVRGSTALCGGERLVGVPAAARLSRLVRAPRGGGLAWVQPTRSVRVRGIAAARRRVFRARHRSMVAASQQ